MRRRLCGAVAVSAPQRLCVRAVNGSTNIDGSPMYNKVEVLLHVRVMGCISEWVYLAILVGPQLGEGVA